MRSTSQVSGSVGGIADEVLELFSREQKELPTKLFYDQRGSMLFEQITQLPEYYPTQCELEIMKHHSPEMARLMGDNPLILEYGSGSSLKVRLLLDEIKPPAIYIPLDISDQHLLKSGKKLMSEYPNLTIIPTVADFTTDITLPAGLPQHGSQVAYCPGSTIGNFKPDAAVNYLQSVARTVGKGGYALIGIDLVKPRDVLERAYNDSRGITAKFNLNILLHINRALGTNFDVSNFGHVAEYDEDRQCIVMKLVAREECTVSVNGTDFHLERGEEIITERSHKYTETSFRALASQASFSPIKSWTDSRGWFSVQLLRAR